MWFKLYINSGYLNNSLVDFKDKSRPLVVGSCGTYRLISRPKLPTWRPRGRIDYQILYIANGKAHFYFNENEDTIVTAGNMVLYRPKEMQRYIYYVEDKTEVYWVHFTGSQVKQILKKYGFPSTGHIIPSGASPGYQKIFRQIIKELQLCRPHYEEFLSILLMQIFILTYRNSKSSKSINKYVQNEIENAASYFNEHYNQNINIAKYAASKNMSTSWFIHNFKLYTGYTPLNYILNIRITNAQSLLETTRYNITEIAAIIGYDNPLYFSRLFKKQTGLSPSGYRKQSNN